MKSTLLAAMSLCVLGASGASHAAEPGVVSVTPGMYAWSQTTIIRLDPIEFPIKEENLECLRDEKSQMSLQDIADDLDNECTMTRVDAIDGGYSFDMSCEGNVAGTVSGNLIVEDDKVSLTASGNAVAMGFKAPVKMSATATRTGDCPA